MNDTLPTMDDASPAAPQTRVFCTKHLRTNLGARAIRGAASIGLGQGSQFVISMVSTGILGRMLTPEDFGLVAMTAVITSFLLIFKDAGLTSATIQREHLTHEQVSTLFWINFASGLLIAGMMALSAPLVAAVFGDPRLVEITRVLSVTFVFGGLTVQHQALLRRQMRFKSLAARGVFASLLGAIVGVAMAAAGFGYWSLVGMTVTASASNMVAVWLAARWMPSRPRWAPDTLHLLKFGSDILICDIATFFSRKADSLLIGWYWGPIALGFYDKAYTLLLAPVKQINRPLSAVFVPTLSRLTKEPEVTSRYFLHALESMASITVPLILAAAVFADELVLLWLGPQWVEAAAIFRLLAIAAIIGAVTTPIGWLQVSAGETRRYRQLGTITAVALVAAFAIGLPYGPRGVAVSYSIAVTLLAVPTTYYALRDLHVNFVDLVRTLSVPIAAGLPAAAIGWAVDHVLPLPLPELARAGIGVVAFGTTYMLILLVGFGRLTRFRDAFDALRTPRGPKPGKMAPSGAGTLP